MRSQAKCHDVHFANGVQFVFINIHCADYKAIVSCLNQIVKDCANGDAQDREKASEACQSLHSILNRKFCLQWYC